MTDLRFTNLRNINGENYEALSELHARQMARAATLGFGPEFTTPTEFLEQTGDGELADGGAELWDVVDGEGQLQYEAWVYLGDTCTVFIAGTDNDAGVGMSQWHFDVHTEPATEELAKALQTAFDAQRVARRS